MKVILRSHYVTSTLRGSVSYLRSLTQKRQVVVSSLLVLSLLSVADTASAVETRKFTVTEATRQGLMGFSAALGGDLGFAGAPAGTTLPGKGYIFNVETGELWHTVRPPTEYNFSDNLFGFNAKMTSNRLIVGDPANPNAVTKRPGAAYVFDPLSGEQLFRLTPSDSFGGNEFGFGINAYQDVAIVGAPNLGVGLGAAYLFDLNTGTQTHKLVAADPLLGSEFGADVAVGADYALVGAPSNYATLGFFPGAAYVFDAATGSQLWKLQPDDSYGGDEFGFDVAIDGHIAVIGAPSGGADFGAAYVFDLQTGQQLFKLQPNDHLAGTDFGSAVDIRDGIIAVGANGLNAHLGSVYLFNANTGLQYDKVFPSDVGTGDAFGISVSLGIDRLFVGSARDDDTTLNAGAAYLFTLSERAIFGDFDNDRDVDVDDINLLTTAVFFASSELGFDLSGNGAVDQADRDILINEVLNTYYGDANLDGQFDTSDLVLILQGGQYEDGIPRNSTWQTGDFDGDLDFTTSDLVRALQTGAYEKGPRSAVAAVPEPTSLVLLTMGGLLLLGRRSTRA